MNIRRARGIMLCGNLLAVVLAVTVGWWACAAPLPEPPAMPDSGRSPTAPSSSTLIARKAISLAEWEPYWTRSLRRPLVDLVPVSTAATPSAPAKPSPPRPKLAVRVVGTILEGDKTIALLQVGMGEVQLCKIGDVVNGAGECRVLDIAAHKVRLRHGDQDVELELRADRPKE